MAVKRQVPDPDHPGQTKQLVMPAFSFGPNKALAQLIVDAWLDPGKLLDRDPNTRLPTKDAVTEATARVNEAGFDLSRAVVITEAEHNNDYIMQSDDEIVFVLPDKSRIKHGTHLLQTAELLMGCTPNGI
jgi:hypothetical protein